MKGVCRMGDSCGGATLKLWAVHLICDFYTRMHGCKR